jgi:superfamily II helicase
MENVMAKQNIKSKNHNTTEIQKPTITCPYCFSQAEKITCENPDSLEMLGRLIRPDEDNVYLCKNCARKEIKEKIKAWKEKVELSGGSLCPCGTGSRRCCLYE